MERIAIERSNLTVCVIAALAAIAAFAFISAAAIILFTEWDGYHFLFLTKLLISAPMAILILYCAYSFARPRMKEIIVIDDNGLMIRGNILLGPTAEDFGPIPWDCICGAETVSILIMKQLNVYITNASKMKAVFGEETMREVFGTRRRRGEMTIAVDLNICKLKGIDLEALIRERAAGKI